MGADHKGPLAAFVVIAVIAAVLLVTSVRSQAAPGWLEPDRIPASVVAAPFLGLAPAASNETGAAGRRRAEPAAAPDASRSHHAIHSASYSKVHATVHPTAHPSTPPRRPQHERAHAMHRRPTPAPPMPDHGRHLGWYHRTGHGHGRGG